MRGRVRTRAWVRVRVVEDWVDRLLPRPLHQRRVVAHLPRECKLATRDACDLVKVRVKARVRARVRARVEARVGARVRVRVGWGWGWGWG